MELVYTNLIKIGVYKLNDGSVYEGEFKNDKIEGYGKFIWSDNKTYEGEWIDNCLNGFGVFIKTGKTYIGNFVCDKKQGIGLYIYPNNKIILGKFFENEIEGLSIILTHLKTDNQPNIEKICFMIKSKVNILINDENEKKNLKISNEFKDLINFYENNRKLIDKH